MLVHPLQSGVDPAELFMQLRHLPGAVWLDSSLQHPKLGRYSYLAADPYQWITASEQEDGLAKLAMAVQHIECDDHAGLPPFQGGAVGMFGYELGRSLERLPAARFNEFAPPSMAVGLYDVVIAIDHHQSQAWLISQGCPERGTARRRRAEQRLQRFLQRLSHPSDELGCSPEVRPLACEDLAPQFALPGYPNVTSDFSRDGYLKAVAQAVEYIHAGDVFQVNLSQRLLTALQGEPWQYYLRLRQQSPAPFSGYFDAGPLVLCSASPERFLLVQQGQVESRPIKGTRPRARGWYADAATATQLSASDKDRAENTMIVDLLRNDLSRVCTDDSVVVPTLCGLETYAQVHHLVSVVKGQLRAGSSPVDLLRASFPGGSITGAPKVRAMEIIAELEPTSRGPYCGSLGYLGFNGAMDTSILIRTAIASRGWLQMPVGGGIVADSQPESEYEETLHKAAGMLSALHAANLPTDV